jgi:hypothetical protein
MTQIRVHTSSDNGAELLREGCNVAQIRAQSISDRVQPNSDKGAA